MCGGGHALRYERLVGWSSRAPGSSAFLPRKTHHRSERLHHDIEGKPRNQVV